MPHVVPCPLSCTEPPAIVFPAPQVELVVRLYVKLDLMAPSPPLVVLAPGLSLALVPPLLVPVFRIFLPIPIPELAPQIPPAGLRVLLFVLLAFSWYPVASTRSVVPEPGIRFPRFVKLPPFLVHVLIPLPSLIPNLHLARVTFLLP